MREFWTTLVLVALVCGAEAAAGQAGALRKYELGECVRAALTNSPDLSAAAPRPAPGIASSD